MMFETMNPTFAEREADLQEAVEKAERELANLMFLRAVRSGQDVSMQAPGYTRPVRYPLSSFLGECKTPCQPLLLTAARLALESTNPTTAEAAMIAFVAAVAAEYADDMVSMQ